MKYLLIPTFFTLVCLVNLQAQENSAIKLKEHKISLSSGKLTLEEVNGVTIEGVSGNEIIIQAETQESSEDDRSAGPYGRLLKRSFQRFAKYNSTIF